MHIFVGVEGGPGSSNHPILMCSQTPEGRGKRFLEGLPGTFSLKDAGAEKEDGHHGRECAWNNVEKKRSV
jgi:hypothetical protein